MITNYYLNLLVGNALGADTVPPLPEKCYIGVSTSEPTPDGGGINEPSDPAYERIELSCMGEPVDGVIKNADDILFPAAVQDWGFVSHYVVFDERNGGHPLIAHSFLNSTHIFPGRAIRIKANTLSFSLKNIETT